jgi:hypothetical protein
MRVLEAHRDRHPAAIDIDFHFDPFGVSQAERVGDVQEEIEGNSTILDRSGKDELTVTDTARQPVTNPSETEEGVRQDVTAQPAAITTATELPSPVVEPQCFSAEVKLYGPGTEPVVKGKSKPILTPQQYDVVQTLIEAGSDGLTKDLFDKKSGHSEARKIMKRLADKDADWQLVLRFPGDTGKRYRIR